MKKNWVMKNAPLMKSVFLLGQGIYFDFSMEYAERHLWLYFQFKSTFHFWLIASNPRVSCSFHSHCFFSWPAVLVFMITVQYGAVQLPLAPGSLRRWQVWFQPHLLWWEYVEGLTWWSLVCCGVPQCSLGSMEVPALFTLSISEACCELLVFFWALGVLRFLGFSRLMWIP